MRPGRPGSSAWCLAGGGAARPAAGRRARSSSSPPRTHLLRPAPPLLLAALPGRGGAAELYPLAGTARVKLPAAPGPGDRPLPLATTATAAALASMPEFIVNSDRDWGPAAGLGAASCHRLLRAPLSELLPAAVPGGLEDEGGGGVGAKGCPAAASARPGFMAQTEEQAPAPEFSLQAAWERTGAGGRR
jgi:hypothetical protein